MYHYRRNNQDRTDKYPDNVCTSTAAEDRQVYHYHRHVNNYFRRRPVYNYRRQDREYLYRRRVRLLP